MAEEVQIYTIPLLVTKAAPRSKKAEKAVAEIKEFVAKHMKAKIEDVWMDQAVNESMWSRSIQKPPPRSGSRRSSSRMDWSRYPCRKSEQGIT
jgi:large subunit ribosomal protein L31e